MWNVPSHICTVYWVHSQMRKTWDKSRLNVDFRSYLTTSTWLPTAASASPSPRSWTAPTPSRRTSRPSASSSTPSRDRPSSPSSGKTLLHPIDYVGRKSSFYNFALNFILVVASQLAIAVSAWLMEASARIFWPWVSARRYRLRLRLPGHVRVPK